MSDRELIHDNMELIAERAQRLHVRVYELMFDAHPEASDLFSMYGDEKQAEMLNETLGSALELLEGATWVPGNVEAMGTRHRHEYVVDSKMYHWFSDAILLALEEASAESWSTELAEAWRRSLDRVNALMLEGRGGH